MPREGSARRAAKLPLSRRDNLIRCKGLGEIPPRASAANPLPTNLRHRTIDHAALKDVRKTFASRTAPAADPGHQGFQVAAGEQAVLMGRSGSGKTTLLHVIAGISRPDSGVVQVDGTDIARLPEAACDRFRAERSATSFRPSICFPAFRP